MFTALAILTIIPSPTCSIVIMSIVVGVVFLSFLGTLFKLYFYVNKNIKTLFLNKRVKAFISYTVVPVFQFYIWLPGLTQFLALKENVIRFSVKIRRYINYEENPFDSSKLTKVELLSARLDFYKDLKNLVDPDNCYYFSDTNRLELFLIKNDVRGKQPFDQSLSEVLKSEGLLIAKNDSFTPMVTNSENMLLQAYSKNQFNEVHDEDLYWLQYCFEQRISKIVACIKDVFEQFQDYHLFEPHQVWVYNEFANTLEFTNDPSSVLMHPLVRPFSYFLTIHGWWCGPLIIYCSAHIYLFIKLFTRIGWKNWNIINKKRVWSYSLSNILSLNYGNDIYYDFLRYWKFNLNGFYLKKNWCRKNSYRSRYRKRRIASRLVKNRDKLRKYNWIKP